MWGISQAARVRAQRSIDTPRLLCCPPATLPRQAPALPLLHAYHFLAFVLFSSG